jgi:uncharacterized UBP type Zn finger protein
MTRLRRVQKALPLHLDPWNSDCVRWLFENLPDPNISDTIVVGLMKAKRLRQMHRASSQPWLVEMSFRHATTVSLLQSTLVQSSCRIEYIHIIAIHIVAGSATAVIKRGLPSDSALFLTSASDRHSIL